MINSERIQVYPKHKDRTSTNGKFYLFNEKLEVSKGTYFHGEQKNNKSFNIHDVSKVFLSLKEKGFLTDTSWVNEEIGKFEIEFIKDWTGEPSPIATIMNGGRENGWKFWQNKNGRPIDKYRVYKGNKSSF